MDNTSKGQEPETTKQSPTIQDLRDHDMAREPRPEPSVFPEPNRIPKGLKPYKPTYQIERPVKCPITTCGYSKRGFVRKYDCHRHTLMHYRGTIVCGFCPGAASAVEKSFKRADVFKRHLMRVHDIERTPANGRKKLGLRNGPFSGSLLGEQFSGTYITGQCSICSVVFATAQQLLEHLDGCVLRKVIQDARSNMTLDPVCLDTWKPRLSY